MLPFTSLFNATQDTMSVLLEVKNLQTYFFTGDGLVKAIAGIDFTINHGETLALVGESGCGKSMTDLSLLRLVPEPGRIVEGEIRFGDLDILHMPEAEIRRVRGNRIGMIFQEPMTSLNPVFRFFFFNDTATTEIYTNLNTLSLHDALPIFAEIVLVASGSQTTMSA